MARVPDQAAFFRDGLERYAKASETVKYFQECVYAAVAKAFEAKVSWKQFVPHRTTDGRFDSGKTTASIYLTSYIAGAVANRGYSKAWISMGLFWDPPMGGTPVVAAAHCSTEKGQHLPLRYSASDTPFKVGLLYNRNDRRLILAMGPEFDPDLSFSLLLDAIDEALSPIGTDDSSRSS